MSQRDDAEGRGPDRGGLPAPDALRDEAVRWLLELQAGEHDPAVRQAFDAWLAMDRRHAVAFDAVSRLWHSPELAKAAMGGERGLRDAAAVVAVPRAVTAADRIHPARRSWRRRAGAIAAVLILAIGIAHYSGALLYLRADYVTATGEQRRIALPDGSAMLLNSGSAVALDFGGARRHVRLIEGEAFFDVARDPDRRFEVAAPFGTVEVTGTRFAVRASGEGDSVTVQEGSVSVLGRSAGAKAFKLVPRHAIAFGAAGAGIVHAVDVDVALAWLEGRIRFSDRPLGSVLDEIRRYHRGIIIVADGRIRDIRVSGNYQLDNPALIVASLAEATGATLTRLSDHVLILR